MPRAAWTSVDCNERGPAGLLNRHGVSVIVARVTGAPLLLVWPLKSAFQHGQAFPMFRFEFIFLLKSDNYGACCAEEAMLFNGAAFLVCRTASKNGITSGLRASAARQTGRFDHRMSGQPFSDPVLPNREVLLCDLLPDHPSIGSRDNIDFEDTRH